MFNLSMKSLIVDLCKCCNYAILQFFCKKLIAERPIKIKLIATPFF